MGIKCIIQVPAKIISDMDSEDGILEKQFELEAIPSVGTKLFDKYLQEAECREEDMPIIEEITFITEETSYLIKTSKISIDSNYLDRINGWGDKYLSQWI